MELTSWAYLIAFYAALILIGFALRSILRVRSPDPAVAAPRVDPSAECPWPEEGSGEHFPWSEDSNVQRWWRRPWQKAGMLEWLSHLLLFNTAYTTLRDILVRQETTLMEKLKELLTRFLPLLFVPVLIFFSVWDGGKFDFDLRDLPDSVKIFSGALLIIGVLRAVVHYQHGILVYGYRWAFALYMLATGVGMLFAPMDSNFGYGEMGLFEKTLNLVGFLLFGAIPWLFMLGPLLVGSGKEGAWMFWDEPFNSSEPED